MVDNETMERIVALHNEIQARYSNEPRLSDAAAASLFASAPEWGRRARECMLSESVENAMLRAVTPVIADDPTAMTELQVVLETSQVLLNYLMKMTGLPAEGIVDAYTQLLWATHARAEPDGSLHILGIGPLSEGAKLRDQLVKRRKKTRRSR